MNMCFLGCIQPTCTEEEEEEEEEEEAGELATYLPILLLESSIRSWGYSDPAAS